MLIVLEIRAPELGNIQTITKILVGRYKIGINSKHLKVH